MVNIITPEPLSRTPSSAATTEMYEIMEDLNIHDWDMLSSPIELDENHNLNVIPAYDDDDDYDEPTFFSPMDAQLPEPLHLSDLETPPSHRQEFPLLTQEEIDDIPPPPRLVRQNAVSRIFSEQLAPINLDAVYFNNNEPNTPITTIIDIRNEYHNLNVIPLYDDDEPDNNYEPSQ